MTDDRRQQLNPAGVAAIPVVTSGSPPPLPAPPGGGYMFGGAYVHENTAAIARELRILGYHYPSVEWDGALAAARVHIRNLAGAGRIGAAIREAYGRGRDDEAAGLPIPAEMGA